jgi:hypothetical protein
MTRKSDSDSEGDGNCDSESIETIRGTAVTVRTLLREALLERLRLCNDRLIRRELRALLRYGLFQESLADCLGEGWPNHFADLGDVASEDLMHVNAEKVKRRENTFARNETIT